MRVLGEGLTPPGAVLGAAVGLRETLILAALGEPLAAICLWYSPVRSVHQLPTSGSAHTTSGP